MKTKLSSIFLSLSISLMRKSLFVILIFLFLMQVSCNKDESFENTGIAALDNASTLETATGTTYYVSPTGSDVASGDLTHPWATWGKAFTSVSAGDIVYFRGGVYYHTVTNGSGYTITVDGTAEQLIYFLNYPNEVPVLDCSTVTSASGDVNVAIGTKGGQNYTYFRGLVVRNVWQFDGNDTGAGWLFWGATGTTWERCTAYNIHGIGFLQYGAWDVHYINCDAYNCADILSTTRPGNTGSGFQYIDFEDTNTSTYYTNCRAWHCSDQGFALGSAGYTEYNNCWAWSNGYLTGEGDGFKLGWMGAESNNLQILVKNCVSAFNSEAGFNDNSSTSYPSGYLNIYNNTSYKNGSFGYMFYNSSSDNSHELNRITRNNISFQDGTAVFNQSGSLYTHDHNSWDIPASVTTADFMSVDSTGIGATRQNDGSLPNNNCYNKFLRLSSTSDLIDIGINVGLPSNGTPDLGAFEYSTTPKSILVTSISVTGAGGSSTITTNKGTLQLIASILPSDASNKSVTWTILNGTGQATITSSGLVTAVSNGTISARATANDGSGIFGTLAIIISNQVISVSGITVTGAGGATIISSDNGTLQLSAAVLPANATNKTVTWSISSGTDKASISSTGLVTAIDNGTTVARATAIDGSNVFGTLTITISNQVIPVTGITVTGAGGASAISTDNGTLQLSASLLPANATNKTVTWSIFSGTDKASVSTTGLVTAINNGTAVARATANDGSGIYGVVTLTITNQLISVTGISVTGAGGASTISTDNGTLQLSAAVLPANATNKTVTWTISGGSDKASVSTTGLITAVDNGTAIARATANDGSGIYGVLTIVITNQVIPVANITVTGTGGASLITVIGGTLQLSAAVLPANSTNKNITWSISSGTDKAFINSTGLVTSIENGTAIARATSNDGSGVYGTLTITISNQVVPVTSISVTGAGGTATITTDGGTLQLNAGILPVNATNNSVTWSISGGSSLATINSLTGLVTATDNGTVTARATANDGSGVYGTLIIAISNQVVFVASVIVSGAGGSSAITTEGGSLQLSAEILPANATNKAVTWSVTSGSGLASVNSSTGLVTAIGNGTITARATANDGSGIFGTIAISISYTVNSPPVIVVNYQSSSYSGFVNVINASGSYDINKDNLTYSWVVPDNVPVSSTSGSTIKYLGPNASSSQKLEFTLRVSDGKTTQSKVVPVEILPYKPELEAAEISKIEASSFQAPYYPYNIIDGNIGTMWSADGDNQWLIIELKHSFSVQHVKLAFQPGQKRESFFDILGSVDRINWEPILIKSTSCEFSGDIQVFEFPPSKAGKEYNYIKLVALGNSTDKWNYLSELKIFGSRHSNNALYEKLAVKLYPNPAKEYVTIRIDDVTLAPDFVQFFDLTGSVVFREEVDPGIREFTIPLSLRKGNYIVQLCSGKLTIFTQKLIVMN